jgi:adenylosuccinate synthase
MEDFIGPDFKELITTNINNKNKMFETFGHQLVDADQIIKEYEEYAKTLKPYVTDTILLLHEAIEKGEKILCEGAQAALLDIDFGSYPFVTSSNPTIGGILTGSGLNPHNINEVYGVLKAYSSRVGEGPYITEQNNETGDLIRELGHEYGTTTKRPRRCGWLDLVALKYVVLINGITGLAINHMDTIGKLPKIKLCVAYDHNGEVSMNYSTNSYYIKDCTPVYEEFEGNWDLSNCHSREDLPLNAQKYLNRIEEIVGVPIKFIGTGAGRDDILEL